MPGVGSCWTPLKPGGMKLRVLETGGHICSACPVVGSARGLMSVIVANIRMALVLWHLKANWHIVVDNELALHALIGMCMPLMDEHMHA